MPCAPAVPQTQPSSSPSARPAVQVDQVVAGVEAAAAIAGVDWLADVTRSRRVNTAAGASGALEILADLVDVAELPHHRTPTMFPPSSPGLLASLVS